MEQLAGQTETDCTSPGTPLSAQRLGVGVNHVPRLIIGLGGLGYAEVTDVCRNA